MRLLWHKWVYLSTEQEIEPETLSTNGAAKVKVMLWSDISKMAPKCGSDEMNLQ